MSEGSDEPRVGPRAWQKLRVDIFLLSFLLVGVGRAIAESISCLLPEMAVATPNKLHSLNLWNILNAEKTRLCVWFSAYMFCSLR